MTKRDIIGAIGGLSWLMMDASWMFGDIFDYKPRKSAMIFFALAVAFGGWYLTHKERA